jgi:ring-1,2-phenylacetyl-CoA epoxidase subunit PaaC
MQASLALESTPAQQFVLRLADTCLIHSQRLAEWCGHAPVLEEDIALANMALDLLGQARALLTHAGRMAGETFDEDQLAFLRDERDYRNVTLAELPRGDFAFTVLRNLLLAVWLDGYWRRLASSSDVDLAAIAAKATKEARYHLQHAADWVVRLGDGTEESARRLRDALDALWPYTAELFEDDEVDTQAAASGLGPACSELRAAAQAQVEPVFVRAGLEAPAATPFRSHAKQGRHSEHMGYLLAEMQHLPRSFPGAVW